MNHSDRDLCLVNKNDIFEKSIISQKNMTLQWTVL